MENNKEKQDLQDQNETEESVNKAQSENKLTIPIKPEENRSIKIDEAGPSYLEYLPGAVPLKSTVLSKPGISKSEVNIRQIITSADVGNAVALTSLSFGTNAATTQENQCQDKIPDAALSSFIDLKKFMASCFKITKEETSAALQEINNITLVVAENITEIPISTGSRPISGITNNLTEPTVEVINEVQRNTSNPVESKLSKIPSDNSKKKTSANISERSDLGLAQRDSLSSIGSNVCRICMTRGRERLISPCNCKGSLANVHLSCLERWLNQVGRNHCELCGYSYPAIRTPRYTVLQALRLWFGNPRNRSHLQSDCLIFWLLSTVTAGLLAVCIVGTQYFVIEGNKIGKHDINGVIRKDEGISHRITETAMDFFMAIVLCGYSVTVYLLWKDHYVMWNRWRRANVNVRLLLSPDSNPVPFVPRPNYNV